MTEKAKRTTVKLGGSALEGVMLPDGSYRMSQTQAAEMVGLDRKNASDFLRSKAARSLLGKGYTREKNSTELESTGQLRGGSRINALTLEEVSAYWLWQCYRGNKQALSLCMALITESLERRFDAAFGVERDEDERNSVLAQRLQDLESDMERLSEAYATDDLTRQERDYLLEVFSRLGIDPYGLPDS